MYQIKTFVSLVFQFRNNLMYSRQYIFIIPILFEIIGTKTYVMNLQINLHCKLHDLS